MVERGVQARVHTLQTCCRGHLLVQQEEVAHQLFPVHELLFVHQIADHLLYLRLTQRVQYFREQLLVVRVLLLGAQEVLQEFLLNLLDIVADVLSLIEENEVLLLVEILVMAGEDTRNVDETGEEEGFQELADVKVVEVADGARSLTGDAAAEVLDALVDQLVLVLEAEDDPVVESLVECHLDAVDLFQTADD